MTSTCLQLPDVALLLLQGGHVHERGGQEDEDDSSRHAAVDEPVVRGDLPDLSSTMEAGHHWDPRPPSLVVDLDRVKVNNVPEEANGEYLTVRNMRSVLSTDLSMKSLHLLLTSRQFWMSDQGR